MRLPRLKRVAPEALPQFRLTKRDTEIVRAVARYRALTTEQIEALFFTPLGILSAPSSTRCQHRLKMLFHHGFLDRTEQPTLISEGRKPFVYFLASRGAQLLEEMAEDDVGDILPPQKIVGLQFLSHLLETNDVRIAMEQAALVNGWAVKRWLDDRTLKSRQARDYVNIAGPQGGRRRVAIVPDGYFELDIGKARNGHFFLEIDRRTETVAARAWSRRDWVHKIQAYMSYYRSGAFAKRFNATNLRILTVTTGERRLENMRMATENASGGNMFWFGTFESATDPTKVLTEPIWQVATEEGPYRLTE